jgi:hypothetical protein
LIWINGVDIYPRNLGGVGWEDRLFSALIVLAMRGRW